MKAILYNRALLVLGFIGLFVAGSLSLAHFMDKVPPCGSSADCATVTSDPSSMWFGVPVAYIGLAAYLLLTALAIGRALMPAKYFKPFCLIGYLTAAVGTLISIGLQFQSFFVIHAMCKWCLASAVTMTLTLIVYAFLYQETSENKVDGLVSLRKNIEFMLPGALTVLLAFGLTGMGYALKHSTDDIGAVHLTNLPVSFQLVPNEPHLYGDPKAPITIIEFFDLNCPSCKQNSPIVENFVTQHPGKVRLVLRQFPLPIHKTSALAAAIDEYAGEKGKFWQYTQAMMAQKDDINNPEDLYAIAGSVNLDVKDLKKHLANTGDPLYQRLTDDQNAGNIIGINATPTFIVMAPNVKPAAFGPGRVLDALRSEPYSTIINGP